MQESGVLLHQVEQPNFVSKARFMLWRAVLEPRPSQAAWAFCMIFSAHRSEADAICDSLATASYGGDFVIVDGEESGYNRFILG